MTDSRKLLGTPAAKVRLALLSGLVLGAGALLAPRAAQTGLTAPQEHAAPLLEEQVQPRQPVRPFAGVQEVAARVREHSVAIPRADGLSGRTVTDFPQPAGRGEAAGFGVFVTDTHVLTHAVALDGRSSTEISMTDGRVMQATVTAYDPETALVLLQTERVTKPPVVLAAAAPVPGTLGVASARWDGRDIGIPIFITSAGSDRFTIGSTGAALLPGMPVYSLDGELVAIAAGDGREGDAFPVSDVVARLTSRAASGERRAALGVGFQELSGPLTRTFGEKGVLINDVVSGGPADDAGIEPGDVLLAIGGVGIDSPDAAARELQSAVPGAETALDVRRGGRNRTVQVVPAPAHEVAALARAAAAGGPPALEARVLFPSSVLTASGIPGSARVLSVNGRAVSSRGEVLRELRAAKAPVPVRLQAGSNRLFAAIEPSR